MKIRRFNEMKIRRFNESKEEEFEEYFIDFIDYGFSYENTGNKFILKLNIRNLQPDFNEIYGMYDMVINRLQETKGISKTVFEFKETVINVMVEIKNEMDGNTIEVIYKGQELKLKPFGVSIYSYIDSVPNKKNIYSIALECYDINNVIKVITWSVKNGKHVTDQITKDNSLVRIGGNNIKIDIENATIIFNSIIDKSIVQRYLDDDRGLRAQSRHKQGLEVFKEIMTPEILSKI